MKKIKYKILNFINKITNKEIAKMIAKDNSELIFNDFWQDVNLKVSDLE